MSCFQSHALPSWLIACHCQEERLSSGGKRLEFQSNSGTSTEASELFFFTDRCPARCCPSRCYAVCPVSSFVFICANLVLMCPLTGRLLFAEIRELRVPFNAVKRNKVRWIPQSCVSRTYFDEMNEAGKFLVLTDCIITLEAHISFLVCFVVFACLWFLLVHHNLNVSRRPKPVWALNSKGKLPKTSTCPPQHGPCHPLPNKHSQFLNSIKGLWKSGLTETTETHLVALQLFICPVLLFHFIKHISTYFWKRGKDKHRFEGHLEPV